MATVDKREKERRGRPRMGQGKTKEERRICEGVPHRVLGFARPGPRTSDTISPAAPVRAS
jgi:hypothetical protein